MFQRRLGKCNKPSRILPQTLINLAVWKDCRKFILKEPLYRALTQCKPVFIKSLIVHTIHTSPGFVWYLLIILKHRQNLGCLANFSYVLQEPRPLSVIAVFLLHVSRKTFRIVSRNWHEIIISACSEYNARIASHEEAAHCPIYDFPFVWNLCFALDKLRFFNRKISVDHCEDCRCVFFLYVQWAFDFSAIEQTILLTSFKRFNCCDEIA